jgi:hypothetical protein
MFESGLDTDGQQAEDSIEGQIKATLNDLRFKQ